MPFWNLGLKTEIFGTHCWTLCRFIRRGAAYRLTGPVANSHEPPSSLGQFMGSAVGQRANTGYLPNAIVAVFNVAGLDTLQ